MKATGLRMYLCVIVASAMGLAWTSQPASGEGCYSLDFQAWCGGPQVHTGTIRCFILQFDPETGEVTIATECVNHPMFIESGEAVGASPRRMGRWSAASAPKCFDA